MPKKLRDPTLPKTATEQKTVKPQIRRILDDNGWFWWQGGASSFGKSGISDILAVWNGVFMAIEAKYGPKSMPTPNQIGFLNSVRAHAHFAFVVDESNIDVFRDFVEDLASATRTTQAGRQVSGKQGARMLDAIAALTVKIPANGVVTQAPIASTVLRVDHKPVRKPVVFDGETDGDDNL